MNEIINQIKRIFTDHGKGDKDFTQEELKLKEAEDELRKAATHFMHAASILSDTIKARLPKSAD